MKTVAAKHQIHIIMEKKDMPVENNRSNFSEHGSFIWLIVCSTTRVNNADDGHFAWSCQMVQNLPCWMASYTLGHPKQREVMLGWWKSLCFGGCCILLPSSMADFVPCDGIMQKAHLYTFSHHVILKSILVNDAIIRIIIVIIYSFNTLRCWRKTSAEGSHE